MSTLEDDNNSRLHNASTKAINIWKSGEAITKWGSTDIAEYDMSFFKRHGFRVESVHEYADCPHELIREPCCCRYDHVDFLIKRT